MCDSSQNTPNNSTSALVVQKSNESSALLSYIIFKDHCIVDTCASDHMTGLQTVFSSYESCGADIKITIADGSTCKAAVVGNVYLSNMTLQSVLHVPNIWCHLISVSKLKRSQICCTFLLVVNFKT